METNQQAAPTSPQGEQGQPSAIDPADYARLKDQVSGLSRYQQTLSKHGLGGEKDFEPWAPVFGKMKELGYSHRDILEALSGAAPAERESVQNHQSIDPAAIERSIMGKFKHENATETERRLMAELVSEVAGKDEYQSDLARAWIADKANSLREKYGDDHPLKGQPMPLEQTRIAELKKAWTDLQAKNKGAQMAAIASGAGRGQPGAAGTSAPSGSPGNNTVEDDDGLASLRARRAARDAGRSPAATM